MNKPTLGLLPLLAIVFLLACNTPRVIEEEPLKTVEQIRKEAHRDANSDDSSMEEENGDDNVAVTPTTPSVPDIPDTSMEEEDDDEFTEKTVPFTGEAPAYLQEEEFSMITEVNLMRADPAGYISYVEEYIQQVKTDERLDEAYRTEEVATAHELIAELKTLDKLSVLKPHEGLYNVGIKHGKDIQQQGMIGHRGSDGTMPWDRVRNNTDLEDGNENLVGGGESVREQVMILLVDSGIPGRGHRKTLLEPKWTHLACFKIGEIGGIPNNWIQVFGNK